MCDLVFKKVHSKGIGATIKSAAVLSPEEKKLWDACVLSLTTPVGLLRAVFLTMEKISAYEEELNKEI